MNLINWTHLGGMPFTQDRAKFMQDSYAAAWSAIARLCGDKTILYGMEVALGNVSSGWFSYNGELIEFIGGSVGAKVKITQSAVQYTYANASINDVQIVRTATCGVLGDFDFSDLKPLGTLINIREQLTQLLSDFAAHTHSWAAITGKPLGYISYVGSQNIGDIGSPGVPGSNYTITIPNQGTNTYQVIGSFKGLTGNPQFDNDISWVWSNPTNSTFVINVREYILNAQNLVFTFSIIKSF